MSVGFGAGREADAQCSDDGRRSPVSDDNFCVTATNHHPPPGPAKVAVADVVAVGIEVAACAGRLYLLRHRSGRRAQQSLRCAGIAAIAPEG